MSEKTSELFTAFAKFQGDLSNAAKAKQGHGYFYADLAQCIDTAKEPLEKNGLAVAQFLGQSESGTILTTMLTHASGQWMRDSFLMEKAILQGGAGKNPAQAMGASITYMRRYSYAAILGMTQEDEDAANVKAAAKAVKNDPAIQMINQAIQTKDVKYISENWQGCIAASWGNLNAEQIDQLNNLIKEA